MRGQVTLRDMSRGAGASVAALAAMAAVAAAGLLLLDADRLGGLATQTVAVLVLAAGGSVEIEAILSGLPVGLRGFVEVMPLGVSLVGALVLGALLVRGGRVGLLVRGATAVAVLLAGIAVVSLSVRGTITLRLPQIAPTAASGSTARSCPEGAPLGGLGGLGGLGDAVGAFDVGLSVAIGPTMVAATCWTVAVVAACWVVTRVRSVARAARAAASSIGALTVLLVAGAWVLWGSSAGGGVLLGSPLALSAALLTGLGVPWTLHREEILACLLDGTGSLLGSGLIAPGGPLTWVALALLLGIGIVGARAVPPTGGPMRRALGAAAALAPVMSLVLTILALATRISVDLGVAVRGFVQPVLDVSLHTDLWTAAGTGLVAGAVAGFTGSLLVTGTRSMASVGWRAWTDRVRR